jgi:hypothetical protein
MTLYKRGAIVTLATRDRGDVRAMHILPIGQVNPYWVADTGHVYTMNDTRVISVTLIDPPEPDVAPQPRPTPDFLELARLGQLGLEVLQGKTRTARESPVWQLVTDFVQDYTAPPAKPKTERRHRLVEPAGSAARVRTTAGVVWRRETDGAWRSVTDGRRLTWALLEPTVSKVLYKGDPQ